MVGSAARSMSACRVVEPSARADVASVAEPRGDSKRDGGWDVSADIGGSYKGFKGIAALIWRTGLFVQKP